MNHPKNVSGGGAALAADNRLRWGVETAYRMLKLDFMPKSATPMRNQRVFLFNWAILLNNMWMGDERARGGEQAGLRPTRGRGTVASKG